MTQRNTDTGEVLTDVYLAPLAGLTDVSAPLLAPLDAAERTRLARFAFPQDRLQFAAGHSLVRAALTRRLGAPPERWAFTAGPWGRPELRAPAGQPGAGLGVSLSRRRGLVACALGPLALGVDVEDTRRPVEGVAEAICTPAELAHLAALAPARRAVGLFALWTLKEAWLKALGTGLSQAPGATPVLGLHRAPAGAGWTLLGFEADPHHLGALAARSLAAPRFWLARLEDGAWRFEATSPVTRPPPP